MKKIYLVLVILLILLAACSVTTTQADKEERFKGINPNNIDIVTDTKTGCKYIQMSTGYGAGLTPLLNSFGEPECDNTSGSSE